MKIKNQFRISIVVFSVIVVIIASSMIFTRQQGYRLNSQDLIVSSVQTGASDLGYIANNYLIYRNNSQVTLWQQRYTIMSQELSKLNLSPQQQEQLDNIKTNFQQLNSDFIEVVSTLGSTPLNQSIIDNTAFQASWSKLAAERQTFATNTLQLSQSIQNQVNELNLQEIILILVLLALFGAYFITNYFITYRHTLKSISELQTGIAVIGSGNLDYSLKTNKKDEIGEIAQSFNQMTTNLKSVITSKAVLEKEISERQKTEEELRKTRDYLENLLNYAHAPIIVWDQGFRVTLFNHAFEQMTGLSAQEVLGKSPDRVFPESERERVRAYIKRALEGEFWKALEIPVSNVNGTVKTALWNSANIYDQEGEQVIATIAQGQDITDRKELQRKLEEYSKSLEDLVKRRTAQLKDAERLAAIGATAGMVGHDIRNPLQAIISDVYLAKTDLASMPEDGQKENVKESLDSIEENVEYINKIVQDLQDYTRPITPFAQLTDIKEIIQEVLSKNGVPNNIEASFKIGKNAGELIVDPVLLKRVLTNLVNNAVQAMPEGGKLEINAFRDARNNNIIMTVQDTGVGISEEIKPKLFTPLFTTKAKGQGFGLAAVKRITDALGGKVSFESEEGKGTKFSLQLPIKTDKW